MDNSNQIRIIRAFATIVIVLYHSFCPFMSRGWGMFDVKILDDIGNIFFIDILSDKMLPTFFVISGMLYSKKKKYMGQKQSYVWKKFDRLMIPYALFTSLYYLLIVPVFGESIASGHLWFLPTLFLCFVVAIFTENIGIKYKLLISLFMIFIADKLSLISIYLLQISFLCQYLFYFFFGEGIFNVICILRKVKYSILFVVAFYIVCICLNDFPLRGTTLLVSFNLILFYYVKNSISPLLLSKIISEVDKHSFAIYVIHHFLIVLLLQTAFFTYLYVIYPVMGIFIMFIVSFISSFCISVFLKKIGFKWL